MSIEIEVWECKEVTKENGRYSVLGGKGKRASKCSKRRWRVLGSMVLADQTERPLWWTDGMRAQYVNSLACTWEPDQMYEGQDWIVVNSIFVSWMQRTKLKANLVTMQGYQTEKKISIPLEQNSHFENHLSLLQDIGSDDDHME
jgi:hypothetical protein